MKKGLWKIPVGLAILGLTMALSGCPIVADDRNVDGGGPGDLFGNVTGSVAITITGLPTSHNGRDLYDGRNVTVQVFYDGQPYSTRRQAIGTVRNGSVSVTIQNVAFPPGGNGYRVELFNRAGAYPYQWWVDSWIGHTAPMNITTTGRNIIPASAITGGHPGPGPGLGPDGIASVTISGLGGLAGNWGAVGLQGSDEVFSYTRYIDSSTVNFEFPADYIVPEGNFTVRVVFGYSEYFLDDPEYTWSIFNAGVRAVGDDQFFNITADFDYQGDAVTITFQPNSPYVTARTRSIPRGGYIQIPWAGNLDFWRDSYTFLGWSEDQFASYADISAGATRSFDYDTILWAVWGAVMVSVTFEPNNAAENPSHLTVRQNTNMTLPNPVTQWSWSRPGHVFGGWVDDPNDTSDPWFAGDSVPISDYRTFHAVWIPEFTLTFRPNGATWGSFNTQTVLGELQFWNISSSNAFTSGSPWERDGYAFRGWDTNSNADPTYPIGFPTHEHEWQTHNPLADEDLVLYAIWIPRMVTIVFDDDDDTTWEHPEGYTIELPTAAALDGFTRDMYFISAWTSQDFPMGGNINVGNNFVIPRTRDIFVQTRTIDVTAIWTPGNPDIIGRWVDDYGDPDLILILNENGTFSWDDDGDVTEGYWEFIGADTIVLDGDLDDVITFAIDNGELRLTFEDGYSLTLIWQPHPLVGTWVYYDDNDYELVFNADGTFDFPLRGGEGTWVYDDGELILTFNATTYSVTVVDFDFTDDDTIDFTWNWSSGEEQATFIRDQS